MDIALTPDLEELVAHQVRSGNYPSAGEVVRDALRLFRDHLELREQRLEALRRDVAAGLEALDRGDFEEYDVDDGGRLAADIKARGRERLKTLSRSHS